MPNRIIKESCRTSPTLAILSDAAERLFWRLLTAADDYGRFEADAEIIKGICFPKVKWTPKKVEECLQEFGQVAPNEDEPLVLYYIVKGRLYGQFSKWEEHQRKRDSKPKFPGPEEGELAASRRESPQGAAYPRSESESRETRDESRESVISAARREGGVSALDALEAFAFSEVEEWIVSEDIDLQAARMAFQEFKDYWRSVGGKRTGGKVIKDWPATFRNRIRDLKRDGKVKLVVFARPRPALVPAEPVRTDPPTSEAKAIMSRLLPTMANVLDGS